MGATVLPASSRWAQHLETMTVPVTHALLLTDARKQHGDFVHSLGRRLVQCFGFYNSSGRHPEQISVEQHMHSDIFE